ncbi:MAG TPA: GNAT family protein [Nitrolancea sp.]|nr:GNAT family protein [Nitrolancea sp.]
MDEQSTPNVGPILNIIGERVALGPLRSDLVDAHLRWGNDWATYRMLDSIQGPGTREHVVNWLGRATSGAMPHEFLIYERASLRPIGTTGLRDVDLRQGTAEFTIGIGDAEYRGKGLGTEATRLTLDYAFTALGLHNVMLRVMAFNATAIHVYQKVGFREIGRRRECHWMGGRLWDMVYMDILASEFRSTIPTRIFVADEPRAQ